MNYLDDYVGIAKNSQAKSHFLSLVNILEYVGLPINQKKLESPNTVINCLGIIITSVKNIHYLQVLESLVIDTSLQQISLMSFLQRV